MFRRICGKMLTKKNKKISRPDVTRHKTLSRLEGMLMSLAANNVSSLSGGASQRVFPLRPIGRFFWCYFFLKILIYWCVFFSLPLVDIWGITFGELRFSPKQLPIMFQSYIVDTGTGRDSGLSVLLKDTSTRAGIEPPPH